MEATTTTTTTTSTTTTTFKTPYFEKNLYEAEVDENEDIQHTVLTVNANDMDECNYLFKLTSDWF